MSDDETFAQHNHDSALTYPIQAGALKKGDFIVIKDHPCKVIDLSVSKTGKHGHAKVSIVALDIFTKQKMEDMSPSTHNVPAPFVKSNTYSLMDITPDGNLSLMNEDNEMREDLNLPPDEELTAQIKAAFDEGKELQLTVFAAMGKEQVLAMKTDTTR